jgi:Protein of unknown function (DUF3892)
MSDHRITCTVKSPPTHPHYHSHIVRVGIGDAGGWNQILSVAEVYSYMNGGNRFYTESPRTGAVALVEKYHCHGCNFDSLRSHADSTPDNNLDNLPTCVNRK